MENILNQIYHCKIFGHVEVMKTVLGSDQNSFQIINVHLTLHFMLKSYNELANYLINTPQTSGFLSNNVKIDQIKKYAHCLFGGKITIPSIVIAGTKGKGSTCAVADSVIRSSGIKSCLFTSPHLVTPRERIKVHGIPISEEHYLDLYHNLEYELKKNKLPMPPFFALHALMTGLLFKRKEADVGVIECGVGGRYDWTKIFDPTIAAITHLEFDHLETLGSTPYSITFHKFGIYTEKSINFTVPQKPLFQDAMDLLASKYNYKVNTVKPVWTGKMGLCGPCAQENTALGVAAASELLKVLKISNINAITGAENATIHGRFQIYQDNSTKWMLDGAHTPESVLLCREWYDTLNNDSQNDILLCATTKKRDPNVLLSPLLNKNWKKIVFVKSYNHGKIDNNQVQAFDSLKDSIAYSRSLNPKSILVTGSLHLVGDVMGLLGFGAQ